MIVKVCNGHLNSWTYYETDEFTVRRLKYKDLGKFEYSYHGAEVNEEHTVFQLSLVNKDSVKYVVVPKDKAPVFLMGNDGKTLDKIN